MTGNLYTSYFGKLAQLLREFEPNELINISRQPPLQFTSQKGVRSYRILAPPWGLLTDYKQGRICEDTYTVRFMDDTLSRLDANMIVKDLLLGNSDAVMLCYEAPSRFCHRHIVARWIKQQTGIDVSELTFK